MGFPRFQSKHRSNSAGFQVGDGLTVSRGAGPYLKAQRSVQPSSLRSNGNWFVCFQIEVEVPALERSVSPSGSTW